MANPAIKPIKILSDIKIKQEAEAKHGLTISGSIKDSCDVGLVVKEHVLFEKDLAVNGIACAEGFTQVGVLDVNGLLHVSGHLVTTGSLEISGSRDFKTITEVQRNTEGLYFVDSAIVALDDRMSNTKETINLNKFVFEQSLDNNSTKETDTPFLWTQAKYVSIDIMVYNYVDGVNDYWANELTSVQMKKNSSNNIKLIITSPTLDSTYTAGSKIRVIASRHTDIVF